MYEFSHTAFGNGRIVELNAMNTSNEEIKFEAA